jgi:hypothetical protein
VWSGCRYRPDSHVFELELLSPWLAALTPWTAWAARPTPATRTVRPACVLVRARTARARVTRMAQALAATICWSSPRPGAQRLTAAVAIGQNNSARSGQLSAVFRQRSSSPHSHT